MSTPSPSEVHGYEVVGARTLYTGRIVALRADEVRMPGGSVALREVVEHPGAVAIAAMDDRDRLAMILQYRHPARRRLWELPAGLLDVSGEDPPSTASRELVEEAGLAAGDWSVLADLLPSPGLSDESVRIYLARSLTRVSRPQAPDDEEAELQLRWTPLADAVRQVFTGELVNAATVAGVLAAHAVHTGAARPRPVDAPWPTRPTAFAARR